jgi:hypothetical protein
MVMHILFYEYFILPCDSNCSLVSLFFSSVRYIEKSHILLYAGHASHVTFSKIIMQRCAYPVD